MVKTKKYYLIEEFGAGQPKPSNFEIVEEELAPVQDGEILVEAVYLSVDPYMRAFASALDHKPPLPMFGEQVAKILESKNADFPVGQHVVGYFGWTTHAVVDPSLSIGPFNVPPYLLPDYKDFPLSLSLGVLGMPGNTAYFGLIEVTQPKSGETVVVSGAAGAVGSHVGQIAKHIGCKVVGIAGSDNKCKWLKDELGFDQVINYKTENVKDALRKAAPQGVDVYFDNVGGEISSTVIYQMNLHGRVSVCGSISAYNEDAENLPKATIIQLPLVLHQLKMQGFIVYAWHSRWAEGIERNLSWLREGKLKYREYVLEGFDKMADAFVGMMQGDNTGKTIIKV